LTIDFLPLVIEETFSEKVVSSYADDNFEVLFTLDDEFTIEDKPSTVQVDKEPENVLNNIDWTDILNKKDSDHGPKRESIEETQIFFSNDTISFSASFMEQEELDAMVLLENIAEMGDNRELPILQEIIAKHTSLVVIDRANELIRKFSYQSPRPNDLFSSENDLSESVFTEIFNLSDVETKFILLEEISRVGDVKEIELLKTVIASESKLLAKKATQALHQIESQIELIASESTKAVEDENTLFEVDFELELNDSVKSSKKSNKNGSTLFDQLCSMSNNFYNKING